MMSDRRRDDFSTAELLEESGPRPEPPGPHLESIRSAAKAEWRKHYTQHSATENQTDAEVVAIDTARERQADAAPRSGARRPSQREDGSRQLLWLAAASLLISGLLLWSWTRQSKIVDPSSSSLTTVAVATVDRLTGAASVSGPNGAHRSLSAGDVLGSTSVITTARQADSLAALILNSGHSLRIGAASRVRLAGDDVVELLAGKLYVASHASAQAAASQITVQTALGTVREIGTQFEVALVADASGATQLQARVREGEVLLRVRQPGTSEYLSVGAVAGEQLIAAPSAVVNKSAIDTYGDQWQWILAGATAFRLDGKTGSELLRWLARETGREVMFQDTAASRAATERFDAGSGTVLPDTALDVLLTLDLLARFDGGMVMVSVR